jgi:two-component system NarL family sensor kinase
LLPVILVSEQLIDARQLASSAFFPLVALATVYAGVGIVVAVRALDGRWARAFARAQPAIDVLFLSGLAATSGGAFSDVRKAFFLIPLAAAFSERPRTTAKWSLLAVLAFTVQATVAGGHIPGARNTWQRLTLNQDLYLLWMGIAATMLAIGLRRRTARTEELAQSRQRLVMHAIESVERERTRLADALHDSPVQNLIAARHDLRRAQRDGDADSFGRLAAAIDVTLAELREEIFRLHPHVLDTVGLSAAFDQIAERHARDHAVQVSIEIGADVAESHRQVLFALGRELLDNAARHARAGVISLRLSPDRTGVRLEVADDGCGIPDGRLTEALLEGHIGLASVSERVTALGGEVTVAARHPRGTTVTVTLPIASQPESRRHRGAFAAVAVPAAHAD